MHTSFDWQNQRVLLTGSSGFLGQHLLAQLEAFGAGEIIAPRKRDYDLRNPAEVERLYAQNPGATMVIHAAATVGGIGANRLHPGQFYYDNIMMNTQMLEQARLAGVPKFVGIGSICSYPKFTPVPFREEDLWNGYPEETNAPFGLAKKMMLVQGQAYRAEYGYNAIHLLVVNLYGPHDNFDLETSHVVPALIRKMIEAREHGDSHVPIWGDGSATRELLYIKDAAEGIALAAAHYNEGDPVNLGSGMEISIRELAETIADMVGFTGELRWDPSKPNGQPRRCLDVSRAEREFGFRAKTPFYEGLRETIAWYEAQRLQLPEV